MVDSKDERVMKEVGLSDRELALIHDVLRSHSRVTAAVLFGSRAKMSHQPESDIDLALQGDLDSLPAESIAAELDELPLPYRFDVRAYSDIQSAQLRDHIERVGKVVYERNASL
jgi:predicted nucleotidyltransferase